MSESLENIPTHCPGPESDSAGKVNACAGCPNQNLCSTKTGVDEGKIAAENVASHLSNVKHKILILSGKGGVGKSTVTTLLARALAAKSDDVNVAVLDTDICGPSQPRMLGVKDESVHQSGSGWSPVYVDDNLSVMSIGFLLNSSDDAVILRGPRKYGLIKQFLTEVAWGDVDYLLIDCPPGTSDEHLSINNLLQTSGITGAIIVTTPQEVALLDVRKEIDFCRKVKMPVIGVVENMAYFVCPKCETPSQIFKAKTGGASKMCVDLNVRFLGQIPIEPHVAKATDMGVNCLDESSNQSKIGEFLAKIVDGIVQVCDGGVAT